MVHPRMDTRVATRVLWVGLIAIVAVFVVLKRFSFLGELPTLPFPYLLVGLSYVLFRVLHMVWEAPHVSSGERPGVLEYFNYTCNFLTFISGPIQRFDDFRQSMRAGPLDSTAVSGAFGRIAAGLFKVLVVSAGANAAFLALEPVILGPSPSGGGATFVALYAATATAFTLYLYFNFSGYMDIVIGVGRLFGQTLPENFNRPFTAQSFLDFWARWHITLSDWFKLYLFNPLLKALVGRFPDPRWSAGLGVVAFFVTFLVMGIWHGTTVVFVIYGLTMGAGASINKLWQIGLTRALAQEFAAQNINVNCVAPGPVNTERSTPLTFDMKQIPTGRFAEISEVTALVHLLCGAQGRYITGQTIHVNGGFYMNN